MNNRRRLAALTLLGSLGASATATAHASAAPVTISPLAGTPTALPRTQISFLGASAKTLGAVTVVGSSSGHHSGSLRPYSSALGVSFVPSKPFTPGERVTVRATSVRSKTSQRTLSDAFTIAQPRAVAQNAVETAPGTSADLQSFLTREDLHPPAVTARGAPRASVATEYELATPSRGPGQHGPMILDGAGEVVWFDPLTEGQEADDLQTQTFHGKNELTWWQGKQLQVGYGIGEDVIANANYAPVAVVKAGNGLCADGQAFALGSEGNAYVLAYSPVQSSLAAVGGAAKAVVLDGVVQEIDVQTGLVMWEWHSLGHVAFSEASSPPPSDSSTPYDYAHVEVLLPEGNGDLLVGARNTRMLYSIDAHTGAVRKRERIPGGAPSAIEGGDESSLDGGGSFTGGGAVRGYAETDASGKTVFEALFPLGEYSYRVFRSPWSAQPLERPAIAARTNAGATAVYASWNGATTVTSWQLLTGSSPSHMSAVSTTPKSGFETTIPAPAAAYVQVRALSASGKALASSKAVQPSSA